MEDGSKYYVEKKKLKTASNIIEAITDSLSHSLSFLVQPFRFFLFHIWFILDKYIMR